MLERNPFITKGYAGPEFFCDREQETADLTKYLTNGNNIALISPRRLGKTELLHHVFEQPLIKEQYYTFIIDIYATSSLRDLVNVLGKEILNALKPKGRGAWESFLNVLHSLRQEISFDINGNPSWSLGLGAINNPEITLDEIFKYLNQADKPCLVAIDEFQQIERYTNGSWQVEATLRTYVQNCQNATFVFSGSHRHMMTGIFLSPNRPFYQSVIMMSLPPISVEKYKDFAKQKFVAAGKEIQSEVVEVLFARFASITAYIHRTMNLLFSNTPKGTVCSIDMIDSAIEELVTISSDSYESLFYQMPEKQRQIFLAIASEGQASGISGGAFIRKYHLTSASSVLSAVKGLLEKDFVTQDKGTYWVYDLIFVLWLQRKGLIN